LIYAADRGKPAQRHQGYEMNTTSICRKLLPIMSLSCALGAIPAWGKDNVAAEPTSLSHEEPAYQQAIAEIESSEGAYAEGLSESLYSLALSLQSQGRHAEAITLFRRGVHLTRINEGLYCPQQIPLVQGEIASHIATQDYALADERQHYLYRVQMRSLGSGDALTDALMQQAKWQYSAYQLDQGPQAYTHLMSMRDLYQQAMEDVISREGEKSPKLLPPLNGMLQAQYLISGYEWREPHQVFGE
jgi:tetratricopeptide (TPR) repeat protein